MAREKQKPMILHIEDDSDQRDMLAGKVSVRYRYVGTESAEEAEKYLEDRNLRLIVLDLALPLMNGFEFLKKNKRHIAERSIPVIITTGLESAGIESLVEEHRCAACYHKPLSFSDLFCKIKELAG
jgi:PleD family two-component response regulator